MKLKILKNEKEAKLLHENKNEFGKEKKRVRQMN